MTNKLKDIAKSVTELDNIVTNDSKGYGYNYASLGDIAKQGYKVPKMKTGSDGDNEYVYYYDTEIKEWIRGSQIVIPDSKGMNKAQVYGSALTYARRYTTLMALSLACDDDKKIEDLKEDGTNKTSVKSLITDGQIKWIQENVDVNNLQVIYKNLGVNALKELTQEQATKVINNYKKFKGKGLDTNAEKQEFY